MNVGTQKEFNETFDVGWMTSWHVSPRTSEPHTQAVKIFLSPSPIKFWSQIPRIKNIPDRGSTVGPNQDPRALIVNFIYGAPCLHKMDRKEDRLTLSNHFIKDDTLLAAWKRTLSPDCIKSRERVSIKRQKSDFPPKLSSDGQFKWILFAAERFSVILWSGLKAVY